MLELKGKTKSATIEPVEGLSLLDLALKANVDWQFSCSRGTCARCRCQIEEGGNLLGEITDSEWDRLEPEEFDQGFRLGCQAIVESTEGRIVAVNKPYF
ncbi:2Fe-2S iron-sulfur cluster-binding protein [Paenibacillus sp. MMS18-CY102]|uniref:2Fe-2S iron-sulfur cluster-binding protein n=1 Tax=Paenibacillus sp. MMS18-CY102 TaxID=2682849 RepID=UPI0013652FB9|nr:2Fe-2S iron-sulfur cluster-binding protein [Paenibacillus sp. MMS18-CY102]MWC28453.1 2Fe-2S iron-sulfur cluster binding domain-containing protein [Paenibacillus sp. MMS18-CY102]